MQTFLPEPMLYDSVKCLDDKRLGKQRSEALTILNTLLNGGGWENHPAVRMWEGHTQYLTIYYNHTILEWGRRGFRSIKLSLIPVDLELLKVEGVPSWIGYPFFHDTHRSNLVRKNPAHYRRFWPHVPDDLDYFWPNPKETYEKNMNIHVQHEYGSLMFGLTDPKII